jgi:hypothetical protein
MPNWCNNTVEIGHEDPAKLKALVESYNDGKFCSFAIPVPESLNIVAGRVGDDSDPKQIDLEAQEKRNLEIHGYSNWYDFCVNEWGTKWDCGGDGDQIELEPEQDNTTLCFDSAWAPPTGVYQALMDQGFRVRAYYYEPGMCFAGIYDENGDDYYDLSDMNSAEVADTLPSELDEMFGISECMAEYEEAEKDDVEVWYEEGVEKTGLTPHKANE